MYISGFFHCAVEMQKKENINLLLTEINLGTTPEVD